MSHDKRTLSGRQAALSQTAAGASAILLVIPQNAPVVDVVEALVLI